MTTKITRRLEFDAGHRVLGHEGKCANLHGHRYVALIECSPMQSLDDIGRVVDFGVIKEKVGKWIDDNWDHNMLLHMRDPLLDACVPVNEEGKRINWAASTKIDNLTNEPVFNDKMPYIVPNEQNPTAEVMAQLLYAKSVELLKENNILVNSITIYETPNCFAVYTSDTWFLKEDNRYYRSTQGGHERAT